LAGPLGKKTSYPQKFAPDLLFPIERKKQRELLKHHTFRGEDIWNIYELLWIDSNNNHHHDQISIVVPCTSPNIVESKSLKLFINSLIHERFRSITEVKKVIKQHLESLIEAEIELADLYQKPDAKVLNVKKSQDINHAPINSSPSELFCFRGFRSLCPVTQQPDIADIFIDGTFNEVDQENIAAYLGSFFEKEAFHELCIEKILEDLQSYGYQFSSIEGYFERRGGIAIIPRRYS
tara:strand:+ start:3725 stop:4432 length:708 start_codon:yes stop_codon:yes gene_type:complete